MKLTNNSDLPDQVVRAIKNDPYNKGECDFSATELLQPPRVRALKLKHWDELEEDCADRLWSLYGQIGHSILERAGENEIVEKRFFAKFGEYKVSAQVDTICLEKSVLSDFKFTSSWGFMQDRGAKPEWEAQLNIQLEILRRNGLNASQIQIVGLLRDWQIRESKRSKKYPQQPIVVMPIKMWHRSETESFILKKINEHLLAEKFLPLCSDEDRWMKASGENVRCLHYCICAPFCDQFKLINRSVNEIQTF